MNECQHGLPYFVFCRECCRGIQKEMGLIMGFATDQDQKDNERSETQASLTIVQLDRDYHQGVITADDYNDEVKLFGGGLRRRNYGR